MNIDDMNKKIDELKQQQIGINLDLDKKEKEIRDSEEYKEGDGELKGLEKQKSEINKKMDKIEEKVYRRFLTSDEQPSYSTTYGINIHNEVITAIKKTFDFKKLNGGVIERIVKNMIDEDTNKNPERQELREQENNISHQINLLEIKLGDIIDNNETIRNLSIKRREIERDINNLKQELAKQMVEQNQLKMPADMKFQKRRALEEYREKCVWNYKEVFKNL